MANLDQDVAQQSELSLRQHEVVPVSRGIDQLRQVGQARPGLGAAGIPQRGRDAVRIGCRRRGSGQRMARRRVDGARAQLKLVHQGGDPGFHLQRRSVQRGTPQRALFRGSRQRHWQIERRTPIQLAAVLGCDDHRPGHQFGHLRDDASPRAGLGVARLIIAFQQQCSGRQTRFAFPQTQEIGEFGHVARQSARVEPAAVSGL